MAAAEVRTFRMGGGATDNSVVQTTMAIAQPAGMQIGWGVYDAYQVMGDVGVVGDIASVTLDGAKATVSNFTAATGDFDISLTPAVGETAQIIYNKQINSK